MINLAIILLLWEVLSTAVFLAVVYNSKTLRYVIRYKLAEIDKEDEELDDEELGFDDLEEENEEMCGAYCVGCDESLNDERGG